MYAAKTKHGRWLGVKKGKFFLTDAAGAKLFLFRGNAERAAKKASDYIGIHLRADDLVRLAPEEEDDPPVAGGIENEADAERESGMENGIEEGTGAVTENAEEGQEEDCCSEDIWACRVVAVKDCPDAEDALKVVVRICSVVGTDGNRRLEMAGEDGEDDFETSPKELWDFEELRDWVLGYFGWQLYYPEIDGIEDEKERGKAWKREMLWAMTPSVWPRHREKADAALLGILNRA